MFSFDICAACELRKRSSIIVLPDTTYWRVILDEHQQPLGHLHLVSASHKSHMGRLNKVARAEFMAIMIGLESALRNAFEASEASWRADFSWGSNAATNHIWWQLVPGYPTLTTRFAGGLFVSTGHGGRVTGPRIEDPMLNQIAGEIRKYYS